MAHVQADHFPHAVFVDCTSSAQLTAHYPEWLARGIHRITPNKKANAAEHDEAIVDLLMQARARGEVLRCVGMISPGEQCSVALKSYPQPHAFAGTSGSANIVAFTTQRYHTQSLNVQIRSDPEEISKDFRGRRRDLGRSGLKRRTRALLVIPIRRRTERDLT